LEHSIPVSVPFDAIAAAYDDTFSNSSIGRLQRELVWLEADRVFRTGQHLLEINCGTGIDALHFASRGLKVLACDSASTMVEVARRRLNASAFPHAVDVRCLAIEQLGTLEPERPYNGIFSNFAGLNCLSDLNSVVRDVARLVTPGGKVVLCLFGQICVWEIFFYALRGDFRKAFRRFRRYGAVAVLAPDSQVVVHYPSVRELRRMFSPYFRLERWRGVGISVPPSYLEGLAVAFPRFLRLAAGIDARFGRCPGFRALADHVVLTFERSDA
jgi:ubiquinone/menaquinone biosynthesis C-methylase UbiE